MHTALARSKTDSPPGGSAPTGRRPVRSVFWPIFLWFWLAMLLLAAAVMGTIFITDPDQFFPRQLNIPLQRMDREAAASVEIYERSGSAALRNYLANLPAVPISVERNARPRPERGYLVDLPDRRELSGLPLPADPRELVRRADGSADIELQRLMTEVVIARPVSSPLSGHRYVFLLVRPRTGVLFPATPQVWWQIAAAMLTSAAVCYGLTRYFVGPVRRLQAAARRLAGGDLGTRVAAAPSLMHRHDEFSELAVDFDDMAARIQSLLAAQHRLIADISHELGSPLTRVNVALGLAFRKADAECRPELERIQLEAKRLNDLIRRLLLISELENRPTNELVEDVDLYGLVAEIAADAEFEAGSRRCRVRVTSRNGAPAVVKGARYLLRSALENIVRNAVRYTREDSEVLIEIDENASSRLIIRVRDHGPGVPPEALTELFRPFYRVSEARDRQSGGTGLGLAITRQAVEAHGGTVTAVNHPDGGLLVEVELPPRTAAASSIPSISRKAPTTILVDSPARSRTTSPLGQS